MVGKVFERYLVRKKITLNLSVVALDKSPELADKQVEKFVKGILENFVNKLVSDKLVKSHNDFDISTRVLTKLGDDDKSLPFDIAYSELVKTSKK